MGDELVRPVPAAERDQIGCDDQPDADLPDEEPDPRDALHGQATRAGRGEDRHDPEVDDHSDGHGRVHAVTLAPRGKAADPARFQTKERQRRL